MPSDRGAEDGAVQPTVDEIDREVERWADSDGEITLARWLMDAFGWDQAKADDVVEKYPDA